MLVIVSFVLVLLATVLLVLGLLAEDGLLLIYVSIACSAAAAIVLFVAVRMARPPEVALADGPAPLPEPDPTLLGGVDEAMAIATAPTTAPPPVTAPSAGEWLASEQDDEWAAVDDAADEWQASDDAEADLEFPIADYDDLTERQILPLLPKLYSDELEVVAAHERATKARPAVLDRIAELRDDEWEDDWFPIEDYDSLTLNQIRPLLPQLEPDELELVRAHETATANRTSVLIDIARLLGEPEPEARKAAPKKAAATKKAAKKAAPAKKSAARRPAGPPS